MTLFVNQNAYFEFINNRKTIEGRVNLGFNKGIKEKSTYNLKYKDKHQLIEIIKIEKYDSLINMIDNVNLKKLLPYHFINSKEDAIKYYQKIYPRLWNREFLAIYVKMI